MASANDPSPYAVSAIVSAYNSERFISDRLQNLSDQTLYRENRLEIIIIDSGSRQNEDRIVKKFMQRSKPMVYLRTPQRESVYGAWNRGIRLANGKFIINANTDDRFAEDGLARMAAALDADSAIQAVYGDWLQTEVENDRMGSNTRKTLLHYPEFNPLLLFHGQITSHAALMRKSVFETIGLYDDGYKIYGDRELMLRFSVAGYKARKIPGVVGLYLKNPRGLEFSQKESGDLEFKSLLDRFLQPAYLARLSGLKEIPGGGNLVDLYARAAQLGKDFYKIDNRPVSNLGTAGVLFSKALSLDESHVISLNNLGIIACWSGDFNTGLQLFEKALTACDSDQHKRIRSNRHSAESGWASLVGYQWMDSQVTKNHQPKEIAMKSQQEMYQDIQALFNAGGPEAAAIELEKMLQVYPDHATAHNDLGMLSYQKGDKEKARIHYEQACRLQPENITFQRNLADFYHVELDQAEDALKIYIRILESNPEDVETLLISGHICVALQKFEDAGDFYQRVVDIEPWNAAAGANLDKVQAIMLATATPPAAAAIHQALPSAANEDRHDTAIEKLETVLAQTPDDAAAHNDLGVMYYKAGDKQRAREHYERSAQLEPANITFQKNLADLYCVELGELEKAMQIYLKVLQGFPEDIESLMAIGYICETLDMPGDAAAFYDRILEIEPWNHAAQQQRDGLQLAGKGISFGRE